MTRRACTPVLLALVSGAACAQAPAAADLTWGVSAGVLNRRLVERTDDGRRLVREAGLTPPATVVIGEVVRLRKKFDWFERRPLFGQRVIVTRSREQAGEFAGMLAERGAEAVVLPVIELAKAVLRRR